MGFNTVNDTMAHQESYSNYYIGTVTVNNDPLGLGRVQANVPGLYDPTQGAVPWIGPHRESIFGYGTSSKGPYGFYGVPPVGAQIKVELQGGDEHRPLYSNIHTKPNMNPTFISPMVWGFQDPSGNLLVVDMQAGTWTWTHSSGDSIGYDNTGDRVQIIKGNDNLTVSKALTIEVTGNASIETQGNLILSAGGTATYTAIIHNFIGPIAGDSTIGAQGDITDLLGSGNSQTVGDMRTVYNSHYHPYDDDGSQNDTDHPVPQIP